MTAPKQCICEWPKQCDGTGVQHCEGCGGDLCVCRCGGERLCPGCNECADLDDEDAI